MKSLMLLWKSVLEESGTWCSTSTTRDLKTATRRFEHEGASFLTISLSNFGKDFERSLDLGYVAHDLFLGFARTGGLPRFLGGFLELVFDRKSGSILPQPSIDAIRVVRQLTLMCGKVQIDCSNSRQEKAIEGFVACEQEVETAARNISSGDLHRFRVASSILGNNVFNRLNQMVESHRILPKHGPGSTADRLRGNSKWKQEVWHSRLESVFPMVEYLLPTYGYWRELDDVRLVNPEQELPVKIVLVPKTLKTPRIIAIEPTCMQYMQQAILGAFTECFDRDDLLPSIIQFEHQEPNRLLAREASRTGKFATLDLSEASDRVSNLLVETMLSDYPSLAEGVQACRSTKANVRGVGTISLHKFASMGSALTFPIEAMVFTTCIFLGIANALNRPVSKALISEYLGQVRVYGDDMIVPVEFVQPVISALETYGFKVNASKSFWTGKFRESCGGDYYDGVPVNPVRVRRVFPGRRQQTEELLSTVALRNNLYEAGYTETASWLDHEVLEKVLPHYPRVLDSSAILGRLDYSGFDSERQDSDLHHPLVKGYVVRTVIPVDQLDGTAALLKFFLSRKGEPLREGHLERAGRPSAVYTKLKWARPY